MQAALIRVPALAQYLTRHVDTDVVRSAHNAFPGSRRQIVSADGCNRHLNQGKQSQYNTAQSQSAAQSAIIA